MPSAQPSDLVGSPDTSGRMGIYGNTEMAQRIRAFDWSKTSLGPIQAWSEYLKSTVNLILQSRLAMAFHCGPDNVHVYNDAYATIIGEKHPQSLGHNVLETWAEIADIIKLKIDRVLSGESWVDESIYFRLDRGFGLEDAWFDICYSPLIGQNQEPVGLFGTVTEVTQRVISERARKEAEARYAMALDVGNIVGAHTWDLETRKRYCDSNLNAMYGIEPHYAPDGIPEEEYFNKVYPLDRFQMEQALLQAQENHQKFASEFRIVRPDGSVHWLYSSGRFQYDEQGQAKRFLGISINTTEIKQIEAEKQKLAAIVEASQDFIAMSDLDGQLLYVNPAGLRMTGRETWQGTSIQDYIYSEDRLYVENVLLPQLLQGGHFREEIRFLNVKTNEPVWVLNTGIAIKEPGTGTVIAFATISPDITKLKKTQDALKQREERYRLVVEGVKLGIWDVDVETGLSFCNDFYYEMLGLPKDTQTSLHLFYSNLHPDDLPRVQEAIVAHLERNEPYLIEYRLRHSSGAYRYFLSHGMAIRDESGKAIRMTGMLLDISDRRQVEMDKQKLIEREQLISRVSNLISQSFDTDFILTGTAQAIIQYLKVDRCLMLRSVQQGEGQTLELIEQACREGVEPVDPSTIPIAIFLKSNHGTDPNHPLLCKSYSQPDEFPEDLKEYLTHWGVQSGLYLEIMYRNRYFGRISIQRCTHQGAWDDEEITLLEVLSTQVGAMLHQAELYQAEQQAKELAESASQQKSQFLANMSHEFRTPLNAILGFSGLMARGKAGPLSPKQEKFIDNVVTSGQHMLAIVNDILDLSKVEAGQMVLDIQPVNIPALFQELEAMFEHLAENRDITLQFYPKPGISEILADPVRLRQILQNLINNAIKFNREAGSIQVSCQLTEQVFHCKVQDTGIGIPQEAMGKLFNVFTQLDAGYSRKEEGTGLGLALTKRLVELHGGSIEVESVIHEGSIFSFSIPQDFPLNNLR